VALNRCWVRRIALRQQSDHTDAARNERRVPPLEPDEEEGMAMTIVNTDTGAVTGGVDTHLDVHVAAALDEIGGLLGVESFEASGAGNDKLLGWFQSFGPVARVGVEGTGSYGRGPGPPVAHRWRGGGRG
jgi:hypothetical protein